MVLLITRVKKHAKKMSVSILVFPNSVSIKKRLYSRFHQDEV